MPNQIVVRRPFRKRGQMPFWYGSLVQADVTGSGGVEIGGSATVEFVHAGQVETDIVLEWDFDNDGDFGESVEDITSKALAIETRTGRDWPSLLTGKAGPGHLRATLRNDDNRFSYFNTSSPLATPPFSLKTGRKLRLRTSTANNPDPVLLAKDRFGRADGALGTPETGAAWSGPLANDFTIVSKKAVASSEGNPHIGLIDVSDTDYYAQARISELGMGTNVVGLVYRYQDTSNYSLAVIDVSAGQIQLRDVVAGTPTTIESESVEIYDDVTIGVYVTSNAVTFYHEGVAVMTDVAIQTDETEVGIYASWGSGDSRPEIDDFYVWDGILTQQTGILWTGDVSDTSTSVQAGPEKAAMVEARGWLSRLATQRLIPLRSVQGKKTGILVGNVLGRTNLLHPPGFLDEGDITTGPVGFAELNAIEAARRFEETEFGFLFESQEGPLSFDSRTARSGSSSQVTFTDAVGGQFGYTAIEPLNWRREIVNQVLAGVAPSAPSGVSVTARSGVGPSVAVQMPATVTAGDLLLVDIVISTVAATGGYRVWQVPAGWTDIGNRAGLSLDDAGASENFTAVFAKVAAGNEDGASFTFALGLLVAGFTDAWVAHVYRVTDWFGTLDGVQVGTYVEGSDPDVIFPSWGPAASLFVAFRRGVGGTGSVSGTTYPLGYTGGTSTLNTTGDEDCCIQSAYYLGVGTLNDPGAFGGTFSGFDFDSCNVVAVRGFNGDPPQNSGVVTVQVDDLDSQDDHNAIKTYSEPSNLFVDETAADTYADLVLAQYADDRPIISMTFCASKSPAYRMQAIRRRVGDRITLVANNNAGLGISQDFYIESIGHKFTKGNTLWHTTWELSPV